MAGLSVRQLTTRLDLTNHARVSRIQAGASLPDLALAAKWLAETGADEATTERVLTLVRAAHAETVKWSDALVDEGAGHLQDVAARREQAAQLIASYEQAYVPGLAQTNAYARALLLRFDLDQDIVAAVTSRMRRQELMHEPGREFRFVLTRRALTWNPDPDTVSMAGQIDRLVELDKLPGVSVRVLDDDAGPMGGFSSFNLYVGDEVLVAIELENDELTLVDDESAKVYRARFEEMFAAARPVQQAAGAER